MLNSRSKILPEAKKKYDQWICETLYNIINEWDYQVIHTFLPMNDEIDIFPLIDSLIEDGRIVIAPRTLTNRKLEHLVLVSIHQLEEGLYGTKHPAKSIEYVGNIDLIITPGLAFDFKGNRLGYGGGYYDTFLSGHTQSHKIGVAYPFQRMKSIPLDRHDLPVNEVISKREL